MCAFIIMWGSYVTLGNVLTPFFNPNGFTPTQISLIGVIFVFSGVVGCYIMGFFIDKTQKHLLGIRIITISLGTLYLLANLIIPPGILVLTCVFAFFAGMLNVPILPAAYSYATKQTGNMPPAVVNGLMMSGAQVYCLCSSLVMTYILGFGQRYGLIFYVVTIAIAGICTICIDESKMTNL